MKHTRPIRLMTNDSRCAFTLIELMVVVGIIAVLMGIVLPVLSNVRQSFRIVDCAGNQGRIAQGFVSYAMDHNGWLPAAARDMDDGFAGLGSEHGLYAYNRRIIRTNEVDVRIQATSKKGKGEWYGQGLLLVNGYVDNPDVFACPEEEYAFEESRRRITRPMTSIEAAVESPGQYFGSYAYRGGLKSQRRNPEGPLNVSRNSGGLAIVADWANTNFEDSHTPHKFGFNIAFLDTHVKYYEFNKSIVQDGGMPDLWKLEELNAFWD